MSKRETERTEHIRPLPKSLPYEAGKEDIQLNHIIENYILDDKKINICDYGCGNGLFLAALSNHPEKSIGVYLPVDDDDDALMETGSHMLNNPQITCTLNACKTNKLDVEKYGGNFDLVILHHVLHEVVRPHEMFEQIFKLLKPEGKILVGDFIHFWWYEPDHVFWDCYTVRDFFDSKKFDVNCISHEYKDKHGHFFAEVSLKKSVLFPKKSELLLRLKNIYKKMLRFYQDKINAITKKHPFKEKPQDVQIFETLALHVMLRLKDVEDEIERKIFRLPYLNNITPPEPNFVGRAEMFGTITEWYKNPDIHIGSLIGWGGEGKSTLLREWYDTLKENNIHPHGIFWWGFYRNAYLDPFLDSLFNYLSQDRFSLNDYRTSWLKVDKIKELLLEGEYLIILDGLEEMQRGEESGEMFGCMLHREFSEILKFLADANVKGLCFITSRYLLTDIKKWEGSYYQRLEVERLSIEEGRALFKKMGVSGNQEEIDTVIEDHKGHALSLTLLATYLVEDHKGDIEKTRDIPPFYSDKEAGGKAHRTLLWYEKQLTETQRSFMKIFSLFRRAVRADNFEGVFRSKMETSLNQVLRDMPEFSFIRMKDNLCDRRLISKGQDDTYTTHPLIKGYFESIMNEDDKKACHRKIYEYIGTFAPGKPETLEEMEPLFEQVYHGCAANLYDEAYHTVYRQKIMRGDERFLVNNLGAWGTNINVIRNFFQESDPDKAPFVSKIKEKSYLINEAGLSMMAMGIGRPEDVERLFKKSIKLDISQRDWAFAATSFINLVSLQIVTGNLQVAKKNSKKAIQFSIKGKHLGYELHSTVRLAYTLCLLGDIKKASVEFERVKELQKKADPSAKYICNVGSIRYAEFLLRQKKLEEAFGVTKESLELSEDYKWADLIFLCYQLLASIFLYQKNFEDAEKNSEIAMECARRTGRQDKEVVSLIALARIRSEQGLHQEAKSIIENALQICQGCGYKLHEPEGKIVLAKVYLALGDIDRAKEFANSAYKEADQMNYHWPKIEAVNFLKEISVNKKT